MLTSRSTGPADGRRPPQRIVVVGAGLAGLRTVAALRGDGYRGHVTVYGAEGLAPYDRPPLTKSLLARTEPAWLADELGSDLFGLADRVELATPVEGLSAVPGSAAVDVALAGGSSERADVVVVATGAHAIRPVAWAGAAVLHTAADAATLRARLTPGTRLVCIGAGWIGAELSGVAAEAGCHVTVLEAGDAPLARQLGTSVGLLTAPWYADAGVDLHLASRVSSVHPDRVHLADGRHVEADVVLVAVGARPSTGWLTDSLVLTPRGAVAVDRVGRAKGWRLHVPEGTVYAVGDSADRMTERDGWVQGGHWASALHDPALVALDILGGPVPASDPAPYTFSTQFGHDLALFGQPGEGQRLVLRGEPSAGGPWTALYVEAGGSESTGVLAAGLAVDAPRDVGVLRRLLGAERRPVIDLEVAANPARSLREAVRS